MTPSAVTTKSNVFHPSRKYPNMPSAVNLRMASITKTNTKNYIVRSSHEWNSEHQRSRARVCVSLCVTHGKRLRCFHQRCHTYEAPIIKINHSSNKHSNTRKLKAKYKKKKYYETKPDKKMIKRKEHKMRNVNLNQQNSENIVNTHVE